jgi:cytochrome P450
MTSPDVVFNPLLPELHANPYPFYRRLREADPVHPSTFGTWILTRYDDAVMVLRDPRFGRETMGDLMEARFGGTEERPAYSRSMLFRDPPTTPACARS